MKRKMSNVVLAALLFVLFQAGANAAEPAGSRLPTQASRERMEWWNDLKFGLFIHWGPWSQTADGSIWDIGKMKPDEQKKAFDLYKTFNPVKYDPSAWAKIARDAGMRYAVLTAKHHDGFCNFPTKQTDYCITNPDCPYSKSEHPDIVTEYVNAFRDAGIAVGLYYCHIDWHHPDGAWNKTHPNYDPKFVEKYPERWKNFVNFEQEQVRELLSNYGKIEVFWFDINWPSQCLRDAVPMLQMMRELQPGIIMTNRGTSEYGDIQTPEQRIPGAPSSGYWETCMTISNGRGFWYKGENETYKSPEELVRNLADIASKGGNFLLDVGPRPDGTLARGDVEALKGMGPWMKENGEAIYGTKASPWGAAPQWGRITRKGQRLYLIVLDWPKDGATLPLALPKDKIEKAALLKGGAKVDFAANAAGDRVEFKLPAKAPSQFASVIAVDVKGELNVTPQWPKEQPKKSKTSAKGAKGEKSAKGPTGPTSPIAKTKAPANPAPIAPNDQSVFVLPPERAFITGTRLAYQPTKKNLGAWLDAKDYAAWKTQVPDAGTYKVEIAYGASGENAFTFGAQGGKPLEAKTSKTGGTQTYKSFEIGLMELPQGEVELSLKPSGPLKGALMNYREIRLTPAK
ncbi:MAG: alpha-L-fucosidase [Candidatus Sumerlaeota bacterium]|nr:alpha-L-fucosidase [Candidatus Sumerlaeota bacterium]